MHAMKLHTHFNANHLNDRDELIAALSGMCDAVSTQYKSQMIRQHAIDEAFDVATKILKSTMNDPEPKHSPLPAPVHHHESCICVKCEDTRKMRTPVPPFQPIKAGDDMRSVLAFHASVTAPEPEHWIIKLAREVAGTPGARAALNTSFVYCVRDLAKREGCTIDQIHQAVAALAKAESILEGKL